MARTSDGQAAAAWQLAIDSGHPNIAPRAALNVGELRADPGNPTMPSD